MREIKFRAFVDTGDFRGICEVTNISFMSGRTLVEYLAEFDDTTLYDMFINEEYGRIKKYFNLSWSKEI